MSRNDRIESDNRERVVELLSQSPFSNPVNKDIYPKPDRSNFKPNFKKTPENDTLDIGYKEGVLSDGRPYRAEAWCVDGITMMTYFMSTKDIEEVDDNYFAKLLENEGLAKYIRKFEGDKYPVNSGKFEDDSKNSMWLVNVTIGIEGIIFTEDNGGLRAYSVSM